MELLSPGILSVLVNILIKLMAVESLVFAPFFAAHARHPHQMALEEEWKINGTLILPRRALGTYVIEKFQFIHMVHFFLFVSLVLCCSHVELVNHGITYFRVYCSKWSNCLAFYRIRVWTWVCWEV